MCCYYIMPIQWLFFASSTYVWLQFTCWYSERGLTLFTIMIWFIVIICRRCRQPSRRSRRSSTYSAFKSSSRKSGSKSKRKSRSRSHGHRSPRSPARSKRHSNSSPKPNRSKRLSVRIRSPGNRGHHRWPCWRFHFISKSHSIKYTKLIIWLSVLGMMGSVWWLPHQTNLSFDDPVVWNLHVVYEQRQKAQKDLSKKIYLYWFEWTWSCY